MSFFQEHRLIHYTTSDFGDPTKYNSRTAEANAAQQEAQRAAQVQLNQSTGQTISSPSFKTAAPVPTNQALQNAQTTYQSAANGTQTTFNPATGNITEIPKMGAIDQSAYDRLIKSGQTPEQALQTIQGNRKDVQQAFNPTAGISPIPGESPADTAARTASILQQNTEIKKQQQIDEEMKKKQEASGQTPIPETPAPPPGKTGAPDGVSAGMSAALGNLPPEAQFLAPFIQQFTQQMQDSIAENQKLTQDTLSGIDKTYGGIEKQMEEMKQGYIESTKVMDDMLKEVRDDNEEYLAKQKQAEDDRLAWEDLQNRRTISKQKRDQHDAMVAQIALAGGFGQDAGLRAVMESDAEFDGRMDDLAVNLSFARTDLAAKYSGLYLENQNNYVNGTLSNMKELRSSLERLGLQSISNSVSRQKAEQDVITNAWTAQTNLRNTLATKNLDLAFDIRQVIKESKQEEIDKEDRALRQISDLLEKFPENEVRSMVLDLGKNVKSFSVESMLNAKSKEEIKAAQDAAFAKSRLAAMTFAQKSANAPVITHDEFINQKIAEKEQQLGETMTEKSRQEYLAANKDYFDSVYDQAVSPNFQNITSGDPAVDAATEAFLRGDVTSPKDAAKFYGVSPEDVLTYAGMVRKQGAQVGDIRALQPEQAKELSTLRKAIDDNDVTKKLNVMDTAIPKIGVARSSLTGVGDVALLNFYQNGIVDPGLAVRAEDATLLRKASALRDKITTQFAEDVLLKGAFFPDETRAEMEKIANQVYAATQRVYQDKVYSPTVEQAQLSGIGEPYFQYKKRQVSDQGANADSYITTFGR